MTLKTQDKAAGLAKGRVGNMDIALYDAELMLKVMDRIAEGETLSAITKTPGMPARSTLYRWFIMYPELNKAYEAARELSGQSFEDELLDMARELKGQNDFTTLKTQQYQAAMQQLRWSTIRRDPARFTERKETNVIVPVQINTSLDLGQAGGSAASSPNVYHIEAKVEQELEALEPQRENLPINPEPLYGVPEAVGVSTIAGAGRNKGGRPPKYKGKTSRGLRATISNQRRKAERQRAQVPDPD